MAVWSAINMSYGLANNRLDAERYRPHFLENEKYLSSMKCERLKNYIADISGGATPKGAKYSNEGIKFVRVQNIRDNYFDLGDVVYIDESIHKGQLFRSQIKESDVLLTITGVSYGNSATAYKEMLPANINQHSVRISLKKGLLPEFLSTFFRSKYGSMQSDSKITGDTRPALTYPEIGNFIIPIVNMEYQLEIQKMVRESLKQRLLSQSLYRQAEALLTKELQLDKLQLPKNKWYTAQYSEVISNNRCDGEYYQPKFKQLMQHLVKFECKTLGSLCDFTKGIEIGSSAYTEQGKLFMRVSNISENGIQIGTSDKHLSESDYQRLKPFQIENGDILCTKDGTIAMCYVIDEDVEGIFSSGIVRLSLKVDIPAEYLTLVINSVFGKMQANRDCSGALITHWKIGDMRKLLIPTIDDDKMLEIADLVSRSKEAKLKAKALLARAKTRVEELIEQEAKNAERQMKLL